MISLISSTRWKHLTRSLMTKELDEKAGVVIIGKENVIMTGMVQKKLPYLIFLKDKQGTFCVCTSFRQQKDGSYLGRTRFTKTVCGSTEELREMTVNEIESVAIAAWKAGQNRTVFD